LYLADEGSAEEAVRPCEYTHDVVGIESAVGQHLTHFNMGAVLKSELLLGGLGNLICSHIAVLGIGDRYAEHGALLGILNGDVAADLTEDSHLLGLASLKQLSTLGRPE
jgi:hypothetical protein